MCSGVKDAIAMDFDEQTTAQLKQELAFYGGKCYYDKELKKIVYNNHSNAFHAYMEMQRSQLVEHRIAEKGISLCVDTKAEIEWFRTNAKKVSSFWKKTHVYVPPAEETILEYIVCKRDDEDF